MGLADMNSGPFVNFMVHFARSFPFPVFPNQLQSTPSTLSGPIPASVPLSLSLSLFFFSFSLHGTRHLWMWQPIGWSRRHFAFFPQRPLPLWFRNCRRSSGHPIIFPLSIYYSADFDRHFAVLSSFFFFFFSFHFPPRVQQLSRSEYFSCRFALKIQVQASTGNVGTFAVEWRHDVSMCRRARRTQRGRGLVNYLCPLKRAWNISDL